MKKTKFVIFLKNETDNCVTAIIKYTEPHVNISLDAMKSSFLEAGIFFQVTSFQDVLCLIFFRICLT